MLGSERPDGAQDASMMSDAGAPSVQTFERRDVWDARWASDDPELLVVCEKNKQTVFRGLEAEEPQTSLAYVCSFENLEVRCADLDAILREPEETDPKLAYVLETGTLKECRRMVMSGDTKGACDLALQRSLGGEL